MCIHKTIVMKDPFHNLKILPFKVFPIINIIEGPTYYIFVMPFSILSLNMQFTQVEKTSFVTKF
jgi:hypothetical protein